MTTVTLTSERAESIRPDASTWADLVKALDEHEGVALVPMETLRRLEGAQRLGVHVLNSIANRLGTLGIGHMPDELPNRQDQSAILYRFGTPASEVISAIRVGLKSAQDVRNTYHALYKLNATPEVAEVVHREVLDDKLTTAAQAVLELLGPGGRDNVLGGIMGGK